VEGRKISGAAEWGGGEDRSEPRVVVTVLDRGPLLFVVTLTLTSFEDVGRRRCSEKYHILCLQQEKCNRSFPDIHFSHQNLGRSWPRCRPQTEVHFARPYAQPLLCVNGMAVVYSGNVEGEGFIHKSKMNSNGTFSVGKTWKLNELRGVEVTDVSCTFVS
jgi:hypothetical protein